MKHLEKINFRHSFAAKICLWMLVTCTCVFIICFGTASWFASDMMLNDGHKKANLELDKAILYVTDEMNTIESAGNNFAAFWNQDRHISAESVYAACKDFLKTNSEVKGVAIGFEPNAYTTLQNGKTSTARQKGFAPYIMRDANNKFVVSDLANIHDFYQKDWYRITKEKKKAYWSDPFVEVNGNVICSYCIPIISPSKQFLGVLAIDMSLDDLTEKVQSVKPYPKSYLTIMDRNLNFVVHPDKKLILRGNPAQVLDKNNYEVNETIFVDIKNQVRGIGAFGDRGSQKYLYYAPIKRAGWTITLECDEDEIIAGVKAVRWQMVIFSVLGILGLSFICLFLMRKFLRPIKLYSNAALHIAEGNFHTHLPKVRDHNELWALGNSLDHMQQSLDKYIQQLKTTTQEKGRIESELNIASKIQMSMIPKIFPPYPDRDDVDIYGSLIPAKAVGGDLYDFFLRDEKLFFCVGDVSGKGVPASLVMAVTRSLMRIVAAQESRPERIVTSLNNSMSDMNESNMFVTLFVGVLDMPTGRMRYCNAGHNAPVIIDGETHEVKMLDVKPNLPIAIMPNMKFEAQEITITPGTDIFMYTDGLTEAENAEKELFGEERMIEVLKNMENKTSKQQIEGMLDAVHQHVKDAEQSDDLTMIAIKYQREEQDTKFYRKLSLHNDIRETPKIADFMDDIVGETGIDMGLASSLNLALEEAVVNVMNYAYPKHQTGNIYIEAYAEESHIQFIITDNGIPFDPTQESEPDITASIEDRSIGGLGIFLVTHLMDKVEYKRENDKNILTLKKILSNTKA